MSVGELASSVKLSPTLVMGSVLCIEECINIPHMVSVPSVLLLLLVCG